MLSTGFRLVTGSWKIMLMSRPRTWRTSLSGRASRSRPWNSIEPPMVALLTMRVRPRMALAVTLLPQPLSPTRPTSSPGATVEAHPVDGVHGALLRREVDGEVGQTEKGVLLGPHAWAV